MRSRWKKGPLKRALGAPAYALVGLVTVWQKRDFLTDDTLHDVHDTLGYARGAILAPLLHLLDLRMKGVTIFIAVPPTSVLVQGICDLCADDGLPEGFVNTDGRRIAEMGRPCDGSNGTGVALDASWPTLWGMAGCPPPDAPRDRSVLLGHSLRGGGGNGSETCHSAGGDG